MTTAMEAPVSSIEGTTGLLDKIFGLIEGRASVLGERLRVDELRGKIESAMWVELAALGSAGGMDIDHTLIGAALRRAGLTSDDFEQAVVRQRERCQLAPRAALVESAKDQLDRVKSEKRERIAEIDARIAELQAAKQVLTDAARRAQGHWTACVQAKAALLDGARRIPWVGMLLAELPNEFAGAEEVRRETARAAELIAKADRIEAAVKSLANDDDDAVRAVLWAARSIGLNWSELAEQRDAPKALREAGAADRLTAAVDRLRGEAEAIGRSLADRRATAEAVRVLYESLRDELVHPVPFARGSTDDVVDAAA